MVDVVITTWDDGEGLRASYLGKVCASWRHWASERDLNVIPQLIVSDDGSDNTVVQDIARAFNAMFVSGTHNGIGASLNRSLEYVKGPWVYTTDDWLLNGPLELGQAEQLLEMYDIVRIGPPHPNLRCTIRFQQQIGWWLEIDRDSGGYPFGTRPFLARRDLIRRLGPLKEGVDSYEFENWFGHRCLAIGASVAAVTLHGPWEHIGEYAVGNRPVR